MSGKPGIVGCSGATVRNSSQLGVDMRAHYSLTVAARKFFYLCVKIFAVGLDCDIILTAEFSLLSINLHLTLLCTCRFGPIYLDFSPRRVMFSGWIGDNDPTFEGMEDALRKYLQSAWAGMRSLL